MSARPRCANSGIRVLAIITASVLSCLLDLSRRLTTRTASIIGPDAALNWSFCTRLSMRAESVLRRT
jgi:hypothetical protein